MIIISFVFNIIFIGVIISIALKINKSNIYNKTLTNEYNNFINNMYDTPILCCELNRIKSNNCIYYDINNFKYEEGGIIHFTQKGNEIIINDCYNYKTFMKNTIKKVGSDIVYMENI